MSAPDHLYTFIQAAYGFCRHYLAIREQQTFYERKLRLSHNPVVLPKIIKRELRVQQGVRLTLLESEPTGLRYFVIFVFHSPQTKFRTHPFHTVNRTSRTTCAEYDHAIRVSIDLCLKAASGTLRRICAFFLSTVFLMGAIIAATYTYSLEIVGVR